MEMKCGGEETGTDVESGTAPWWALPWELGEREPHWHSCDLHRRAEAAAAVYIKHLVPIMWPVSGNSHSWATPPRAALRGLPQIVRLQLIEQRLQPIENLQVYSQYNM